MFCPLFYYVVYVICIYHIMAPRSFPAGSKTTFLPICLCNDLLYSSSSYICIYQKK